MLPQEWLAMLQQHVQNWSQQQLQNWSQQRQPGGGEGQRGTTLLSRLKWKWPWQVGAEQKQRLQDEIVRRRQQIEALQAAVKAESVVDLEDILCAMVMSECVYKRPEGDMIRAVNKFKTDFGGQLVSVQRIQASLDHVPHQYLLAESDSTLYASFIGTKAYKDVIADASFLQRDLFKDEPNAESNMVEQEEELDGEAGKPVGGGPPDRLAASSRPKSARLSRAKPAVHSGFLARAKGIPVLEIYRLAQKKDRRLVLCGHSLGGAVAVLATLAILRACASVSVLKPGAPPPQIRCITFSQPPVGNSALRDYVHRNGWQRHFRTYCIPEDVVPRILSPAYFQHFRRQASELESQQHLAPPLAKTQKDAFLEIKAVTKKSETEGGSERVALGVGPIHDSFWRLNRLVPRAAIERWLPKRGNRSDATTVGGEGTHNTVRAHAAGIPGPMEIREGGAGVELTPLDPPSNMEQNQNNPSVHGSKDLKTGEIPPWRRRVPYLPQLPEYVPFGELYLLERSSVEPVSASEYTKLTTVQSVLLELRGRFQSHTMKSYRTRFQRMYDVCMTEDFSSLSSRIDHLPHLPHLQKWFGIMRGGLAEAGMIAESISIQSATSLVPLGWTGSTGERRRSRPLVVDVQGYGLHHCTLVQAQVNGRWCATAVEVPPSHPTDSGEVAGDGSTKLQRLQIRIGPPLQKPVRNEGSTVSDYVPGVQTSLDLIYGGVSNVSVVGLEHVVIYCSTDFVTVAKGVALRLRRVRFLGLDGAGKTSLCHALLGRPGTAKNTGTGGGGFADTNLREGVNAGVHYVDGVGINLQNLDVEAKRLRQELNVRVGELSKKLDLVILVHNLAHKIPYIRNPAARKSEPQRPALGLLIDEVTAAGIPFVLAITNKFSVSADHRQLATAAVMDSYEVPPTLTVVLNSRPYRGNSDYDVQNAESEQGTNNNLMGRVQDFQNLIYRPFQGKVVVPAEGVNSLQQLVHNVLQSAEEAARQELLHEVLALEMANRMPIRSKQPRPGQVGTAAMGAALGAGISVFVAILLGAANSLRTR